MKRRVLLSILFVLVMLFPGVAAAQTVNDADEGFIFRANGDVTVAQGEKLGGVIVANGNAVVHGTVTETLWVISGDATIDGTVTGDVLVIDGTLHLASAATVENVTLVRGTLDRADGASITGDLTQQDNLFSLGWGAALFSIAMWLGVTVVLVVAALVFAWAGGRQLTVAGQVLRARWAASIVTGIALFVGLPILAVLALVTIVGIPLGVTILVVVMPALWVLGYLVSGTWLGRLVVQSMGRTDRPERPLLAAGLGVLLLQLIGLIPALGPAVALIAGMLGAGALAYRIVGRPVPTVREAVPSGESRLATS
jgi:hypothetical protein